MVDEAEKHLDHERRIKQLETSINQLQALAKDLKTMKGRMTRLERRIQDVELLDFQQQITKLSIDLNSVASGTLAAQRHVAWLEISSLQSDFFSWLSRFTDEQAIIGAAREFTMRQSGASQQAIATSVNPKSASDWFRSALFKYCTEQRITYFMPPAY